MTELGENGIVRAVYGCGESAMPLYPIAALVQEDLCGL